MEKILIIQHDPRLKLLFELEGYMMEAGPDGRTGLAAFRRFRPTLVILDLELPQISGREA